MKQFKHIMSFIICSKWADERDFAMFRAVQNGVGSGGG
jgi:hypothetical protein